MAPEQQAGKLDFAVWFTVGGFAPDGRHRLRTGGRTLPIRRGAQGIPVPSSGVTTACHFSGMPPGGGVCSVTPRFARSSPGHPSGKSGPDTAPGVRGRAGSCGRGNRCRFARNDLSLPHNRAKIGDGGLRRLDDAAILPHGFAVIMVLGGEIGQPPAFLIADQFRRQILLLMILP
jgi:hypothetical protein